jgi:hypothetical protein
VRRLRPGLTAQELETTQRAVAIDMAMLTALVGRIEAAVVERSWEHRLNAMYNSPRGVDKALNRWGIEPQGIEALWFTNRQLPTALRMIELFILKREELEGQVAQGRSEKRRSLRELAENSRDIFGEAVSDVILTRDSEYMRQLENTIAQAGDAAAAARAKGAREGK